MKTLLFTSLLSFNLLALEVPKSWQKYNKPYPDEASNEEKIANKDKFPTIPELEEIDDSLKGVYVSDFLDEEKPIKDYKEKLITIYSKNETKFKKFLQLPNEKLLDALDRYVYGSFEFLNFVQHFLLSLKLNPDLNKLQQLFKKNMFIMNNSISEINMMITMINYDTMISHFSSQPSFEKIATPSKITLKKLGKLFERIYIINYWRGNQFLKRTATEIKRTYSRLGLNKSQLDQLISIKKLEDWNQSLIQGMISFTKGEQKTLSLPNWYNYNKKTTNVDFSEFLNILTGKDHNHFLQEDGINFDDLAKLKPRNLSKDEKIKIDQLVQTKLNNLVTSLLLRMSMRSGSILDEKKVDLSKAAATFVEAEIIIKKHL